MCLYIYTYACTYTYIYTNVALLCYQDHFLPDFWLRKYKCASQGPELELQRLVK